MICEGRRTTAIMYQMRRFVCGPPYLVCALLAISGNYNTPTPLLPPTLRVTNNISALTVCHNTPPYFCYARPLAGVNSGWNYATRNCFSYLHFGILFYLQTCLLYLFTVVLSIENRLPKYMVTQNESTHYNSTFYWHHSKYTITIFISRLQVEIPFKFLSYVAGVQQVSIGPVQSYTSGLIFEKP